MNDREYIKRELEDLAPTLAKLKKPAQKAPEDYFDSLQYRVMKQVEEEIASVTTAPEPSLTWWEQLFDNATLLVRGRYAIPALALVGITVAVILVFSNNDVTTPTGNSIQLAELSNESLEDFLTEEDWYAEDLLTEETIATSLDENISEEAMQDYIIDHTDLIGENEWL